MTTILAYDFGTTSLKAAVIEDGRLVAEANSAYPIRQEQPGWAEQDPDLLWDAACQAGRRALEGSQTGEGASRVVDAVVFVAPWKAIIPVADGAPLRDAIIWMDGRAAAQADRLNAAVGEFVGTGQEYWPRLMWLKESEAAVWQRAEWFMGMTTYLRWRATGVVVTEPSDDFMRSEASMVAARLQAVLRAAGLDGDVDRFPPVVASTSIVGRVTAEAAAQLGVPEGTAVAAGFGDLPAITVGADAARAGDVHIYFGTSSWLSVVEEAHTPIDAPLHFALDENTRAATFALQTGCLAYDWIVEQMYGAEKAHLNDGIQQLVNAEVAEVPAGADNLLATHWLNGELPPLSKSAKGLFLNLTTSHDRRHMVRAMMESICYSHRASLARWEEQTGERRDEVRVVGGGAVSTVWMQMLADVLGRTVVVPDAPRYAGVLGAYACAETALIAAGGAARVVASSERPVARFTPDPANVPVYDRLFAISQRLFPALSEIFADLNAPATQEGTVVSS